MNFDEEIVGADVDPAAAMDKAEEVLTAFAPVNAKPITAVE
jgi:hypothetical protein